MVFSTISESWWSFYSVKWGTFGRNCTKLIWFGALKKRKQILLFTLEILMEVKIAFFFFFFNPFTFLLLSILFKDVYSMWTLILIQIEQKSAVC